MQEIPSASTQELPWDQIRDAAKTRRENVVAAWNLKDECVVIPAGEEEVRKKGDQAKPFYTDPDSFHLTGGRTKPGEVLVFDPKEGWTLFSPPQDPGMVKWQGPVSLPEDTGIDHVLPVEQLGKWLKARRGEKVIVLDSENTTDATDDMNPQEMLPGPSDMHVKFGLAFEPKRWRDAQRTVNYLRTKKDPVELHFIRQAVAVTRGAFNSLLDRSFAGKTEIEIVDFLEGHMRAHGAKRLAFDTIAGHGANLHGEPTNRIIGSNEVVLVDGGAEVKRHCGDVTRVFPAGAKFVGMHRDLYIAVLAAQKAAIDDIHKGAEFRNIHKATVGRFAQSLIDIGILKGRAEDRVEDGSCELFFPHGLGHMMGIDVHDLRRYVATGRRPSLSEPGKRNCRVDFPIEPSQVFTIEPGLYFAPWLFTPEIRERYRDAVNWAKVDQLLATGKCGFRIEDDVLVGPDGEPIILTDGIPKEIDDVEAARAA
ncbi:MAG: aminopeptidase P N-terminal domain-containing protein [Candidatus Peregrinibacteria bacterium]